MTILLANIFRPTAVTLASDYHAALDGLVLAVSELVTNAVTHADTGCDRRWVLVQLFEGAGFFRLAVTDPGSMFSSPHHIPSQQQKIKGAEDGRGLAIVAELSRGRWGTSRMPISMHRVVWCDLDIEVSEFDADSGFLMTNNTGSS